MGATNIEQFYEDMDEWDSVFDPTDKPEYSHAQLIRFAEGYAKHLAKCSCGQTQDPDGNCDGSHENKIIKK